MSSSRLPYPEMEDDDPYSSAHHALLAIAHSTPASSSRHQRMPSHPQQQPQHHQQQQHHLQYHQEPFYHHHQQQQQPRYETQPTPNVVIAPASPVQAQQLVVPPTSTTSNTKSKGKPKAKAAAKRTAKAEGDEGEGEAETAKKRKRVVVACDTCRRKKIKCEGLPNAANTCNNCMAYQYTCKFSADAERSRGKYEILEARNAALLKALREVAPDVAASLDGQGPGMDFTASNGDGIVGRQQAPRPLQTMPGPPAQDTESDAYRSQPLPGRHEEDEAWSEQRAARILALGPTSGYGERRSAEADASGNKADPPALRTGISDNVGQLLPDLEDGRPRYFGVSSTLSLFNSVDSRPPSRRSSIPSAEQGPTSSGNDEGEGSTSASGSGTGKGGASSTAGTSRSGAQDSKIKHFVMPRPRPLYPGNSREWVKLLRRKNTVAIGRDELATEEWFTRHMLPPNDLVFSLVGLFFTHLHPLMPILHRPSLERDILAGRATHDTAFRGLVFCVLAIAARFSTDSRVRTDPEDADTAGDLYAAGSRLYHQVFAASLTNVQVCILTSCFMHGSIGPGTAWTVLGVGIRALLDVGLHQERALQDLTPFEQELRRRTFWGAYILDCIFGLNMGRPMALRFSDCNVRLPLCVSDDTLMSAESGGSIPHEISGVPLVMSGFIHLIKLNLLVQDVVETLYAPRWRGESMKGANGADGKRAAPKGYREMAVLCKRLDEWVAAMPAHLLEVCTSPFRLQAGILKCGTHDVRLYILKPFLDDPVLRRMLHPQCTEHARKCLSTVYTLYEQGELAFMVFIFQQAFMSTSTFLITVWHMIASEDPLGLKEDVNLIEASLHMFAAFDDRYVSPVFKKAHRMLVAIAQKAIPTMCPAQRERTENLVRQRECTKAGHPNPHPQTAFNAAGRKLWTAHDPPRVEYNVLPPSPAPWLQASNNNGTLTPAGAGGAGMNSAPVSPSTLAMAAWRHWLPTMPRGSGRTAGESADLEAITSGLASASENGGTGAPGNFPRTGTNGDTLDGTVFAEALTEASLGGDVHGVGLDGFGPDMGAGLHPLEDLAWTDYFERFLGELDKSNPTQASANGSASGAASGSDTNGSSGKLQSLASPARTPGSTSPSFSRTSSISAPSGRLPRSPLPPLSATAASPSSLAPPSATSKGGSSSPSGLPLGLTPPAASPSS